MAETAGKWATNSRFGPVSAVATRIGYATRQGSRVAFYALLAEAMQRITRITLKDFPKPPSPVPDGPVPDRNRIFSDIGKLFLADLRSIERGEYPKPGDGGLSPRELFETTRAFLKDVPEVARRRAEAAHQEVFHNNPEPEGLPRYYKQNFHFQTDGWLSEGSARLYEFQVEVLFKGATAAMRRRGLVPLNEILRKADRRKIAYVDVACGAGGFLRASLEAFPGLRGTGVDLSEPYLSLGKQRMGKNRACFVNALAEKLPFADQSLDVVSCVFLFHELPPKVRRQVAGEFARVLKPGGSLLFVDSLQTGDEPDYDGLLSLFPQLFHEPYYNSYLSSDLEGLFARAGLRQTHLVHAFVSKVAAYRKG